MASVSNLEKYILSMWKRKLSESKPADAAVKSNGDEIVQAMVGERHI